MEIGLNIFAIVTSNALGAMLLLVILYGNRWRLFDKSKEGRAVLIMIGLVFVSCIVDPIASLCDGQPGTLAFIGVYVCNLWLFLSNLFFACVWLIFICLHLNVPITKTARIALAVIGIATVLPLVVNFFVPLAFSVDSHNAYHRGPLYLAYIAVGIGFMVASVFVYLKAKHDGGALKIFPIGLFLGPVIVGIVTQTFNYGISFIWPCMSIAIAGVVAALQNEAIYHDRLTGLYSRTYLDYLKQQLASSKRSQFTAIMLDLNGFKVINDTYGHSEGDAALIVTGELLKSSMHTLGVVVRYAGDEFIVLLNTQDCAVVQEVFQSIMNSFKHYNETSGKGYCLSLAAGMSKVDLSKHSVDELMNEIDRRMFEDKRRFYEEHPEQERRGRVH